MSPQAYAEMAVAQSEHWWFAARRDILREELRGLGLAPHARILEVGSGTGANLALLSGFGEVVGLEMNAQAVSLARNACTEPNVVLRIGRCPEDLRSLGEGSFDLVCLFDVLEHIEADVAALAALRRLLRPGAAILMTVPAYPWLWGPHDLHLHHHRRYTIRSVEQACSRAGLRVTRWSFFNTLLFPLALAARCHDRIRHGDAGGTRTPPAPLNALLRAVFAFERHLLRLVRLPFGLSLLVLARPAPEAPA